MATPTPTGSQPSMITSSLLAVTVIFPVLGTLAVGLRFWVKIKLKKQRTSMDDWICALAQLAAWGISIDTFVAAGMAGVEYTYPSLDSSSTSVIFFRMLWIEGFPLVISLSLVKIAIILFYARIFTTPKFKLAVHIYCGILTAWCISMVICQLLAGDPIQNAWLFTGPLRYDYNAFSLAFAGMSIVFDVIVLCFPLPAIRELQMTWTRKLQVIAVFWLGIFCCVSSAIRFYFLYSQIRQVTSGQGYRKITTAYIWGTVEPNTSIIAACLPCYAPLFVKGQGISTLLANFGSLFSSGRNKAKATQSSDATWPPGTNDSYEVKESRDVPWDPLHEPLPTHNVDIERGSGWQVENKSLKDVPPNQIKVMRDFTTTDTRA